MFTNTTQRNVRQLMLMRVADDDAHAGKRGDLLWRALRVASGYDYFCFGILPSDPADGGARILIGGRGDGTRIQHHDRGLRRGWGARQTLELELALQSSAVGLGGAATEVLYVVSGHVSIVKQSIEKQNKTRRRTRPRCLAKNAPKNQAEAAVRRD